MNIDKEFIDAFMQSMRWDLSKKVYQSDEEYKTIFMVQLMLLV